MRANNTTKHYLSIINWETRKIGSIYEDLEKYDSAWNYFNQSLQLYDQANDQVAGIEVINNLGDIYRRTGRYRDAISKSNEALARANKRRQTRPKETAAAIDPAH
ncbi:hypothetical protein A4D02_26100 [Niastella koreensis]|uniref:Tetratricopeptide TPR_1 repeat-containing protein n=1 Tax=Niastella koreensis TaxID=354356 RepID=A0ABX3P0L5_9BACT|nr:tetratricopeptide repeat protein [Niastella koreensis]OQP51587.1 hypothetical protein A4D02_26100 [Niastella koreensis]